MVRIAATAVISVVANAIALLVAAAVLESVSVHPDGFMVAVLVFTVVSVIVEPLIQRVALRKVPAILGGTALVATLISLVIASKVADGLTVEGLTTWVMATVVVWIVALVLRLSLPLVMFREILRRRQEDVDVPDEA